MTHHLFQNPAQGSKMRPSCNPPRFAEITRQRVPTRTNCLWMPRTDGVHPGQER